MKNTSGTYPDVKAFLDREVAFAKENGYSVTLFGRRRPIPELKSSNFMQRSFGERRGHERADPGDGGGHHQARHDPRLETSGFGKAEIQADLQIHDELLVETAPGEGAEGG